MNFFELNNIKMSLPERTPWEMVQEFFKKFDGKNGNYTEVELKNKKTIIKLYKNSDGSITVYDPSLEFDIASGHCSVNARILITGKIAYNDDVLDLELTSAHNIILSKGKYGGNSYYSIDLSHYEEDGHKIRLLVSEPGAQSMSHYISNVIYEGENDMVVQSIEQSAKKSTVQIDVDKPWDLMVAYLRSSLKGNDINKDEVNRVIFYLKNDGNKYLEENSIQILTMERGNDGNISIVYVSNKLNEIFNEIEFKGIAIKKENLLVGEDGERKELQIYGVKECDDYISLIYIDEYPRGNRGRTMRLGFAMKFEGNGYILRTNSYKIIGMEVY